MEWSPTNGHGQDGSDREEVKWRDVEGVADGILALENRILGDEEDRRRKSSCKANFSNTNVATGVHAPEIAGAMSMPADRHMSINPCCG